MIRYNTTRRDGTGLVVREEPDGNLYGYVIALAVETKTFRHVPHRGGREFVTHVGREVPSFVFKCPLGLASAGIWKTGREMANATLREFEKARAKIRGGK